MVAYQRNIRTKLWLLRLLFILLALVLFYCVKSKNINGLYFVGVLFLFCSLIQLSKLDIQSQAIHLTRFYFFGIFPVMEDLATKNIRLYSFYDDDQMWEHAIGCFALFFKAKYQGMIVKEEKNRRERRIQLKDEEFGLIKIILSQNPLNKEDEEHMLSF